METKSKGMTIKGMTIDMESKLVDMESIRFDTCIGCATCIKFATCIESATSSRSATGSESATR